MSHRVHPKIFRLKEINDWDSRGFYRKKFPQYLEEDLKIRNFLEKKLGKIGIEKIEIERFSRKTNIIISSARPGLIIGRGGEGVEMLKKELINKLKLGDKAKASSFANAQVIEEDKREIRLEIKEIKDPWSSASLAGQWIAQQIERRIHPRRALKQALSKILSSRETKGCRLEISGRLGGAEIARRILLKEGKMPRQTIRAEIDYALTEAHCTYGVIGIKVWIYKGEKF